MRGLCGDPFVALEIVFCDNQESFLPPEIMSLDRNLYRLSLETNREKTLSLWSQITPLMRAEVLQWWRREERAGRETGPQSFSQNPLVLSKQALMAW